MFLDVPTIQNPRSLRPAMATFTTMDNYLRISRSLIRKHAKNFATPMLKSEDIVSNIATDIMTADWKWDGRGTQEGYRDRFGKWAIFRYIKRYFASQKFKEVSLQEIGHQPHNRKIDAPDYNLNKEEESTLITQYIQNSGLSETQKKYIIAYFLENKTYEQLAEEDGISRQAVHSSVKLGLQKIKDKWGDIHGNF